VIAVNSRASSLSDSTLTIGPRVAIPVLLWTGTHLNNAESRGEVCRSVGRGAI
jgi:hypothetical protein